MGEREEEVGREAGEVNPLAGDCLLLIRHERN